MNLLKKNVNSRLTKPWMNTPLLDSYKKTINSYDEVINKSGEVKPYWATILLL
jgi:hypothetical protein